MASSVFVWPGIVNFTSQTQFASGTAAAPGISFTASQNSGFFFTAGGGIGVSSAAVAYFAFYANEMQAKSTASLTWSSANIDGTDDTNISRVSAGLLGMGTGAQGSFAGGIKLTNLTLASAAPLLTTSVALTDASGAGAGTLLNAPTAGNPTKWIQINDNGTTRKIPTWT